MEAGTINCPMCGAATSTDAPQCQYCEAQLATVACPSCFAMMFLGSKHCPRCGAAYAREHEVASGGRKCPRCRIEMQVVSIGTSKVLECAKCLGLWLNTQSFEKLCADKEQQSAVLGNASLTDRSIQQTKVNYVPCPECSQLMNRANFARCSGVIIDFCKQHGIWFDRNELSRIVEFIRSGGLEMSRAKEKNALEEERRKLQQEQLALDMHHSGITALGEQDRVSGIASASGLLKFLLG
jgi:Zn-finger nucleic acid-binding protein